MMKQLAALVAVLPIAAFAQGAGPARGGPGPGHDCANCQQGKGAGPGTDERIEKMEKRAQLARNLGLAEALDLDTAQSNKLSDALAKVDDKRVALHKQTRDARQLLRRAAQGEKVTAAEVDGAIAKLLDLRAQADALDKETIAIVTKELSPEKKARAALFLARFEQRMGPVEWGREGAGGMGGEWGPARHGTRHGSGPDCPDCDDDEPRPPPELPLVPLSVRGRRSSEFGVRLPGRCPPSPGRSSRS